jgi:peroxiredoxin
MQLMGRRAVFVVAGVPLAALLAAMAIGLARGRDANPAPGPSAAPAFTSTTLAGERFALAERSNGPVLVYFWSSWCAPCAAEAPVIQQLWGEYRARGYTFVGVNIWDADKDARAFADRYGLTFPLVRDANGAVYLGYGVQQLPMAFFLRPGLRVEERYLGQLEEAGLRRMLDQLAAGS